MQVVAPAAAGQALADGPLGQQRFKAGADVRHVVLQKVDALRVGAV